jgi:hypothetical protein
MFYDQSVFWYKSDLNHINKFFNFKLTFLNSNDSIAELLFMNYNKLGKIMKFSLSYEFLIESGIMSWY